MRNAPRSWRGPAGRGLVSLDWVADAKGSLQATYNLANCKRFALPASAQPSLREGSGTPKSSVGKVRILLKACDRTSSPVLVRCSEAVLLGRFEIQNQDYLSCSLEKQGPLSGNEHF